MELQLEPYNEFDQAVFSQGSDNPLDGACQLYEVIEKHIAAFDFSDHNDRSNLMVLEAQIAMLWRLSSYFYNEVTSREDAQKWQQQALAFFDRETARRGDGATPDIMAWRIQIISGFERLQTVLPSKTQLI